MTREKRPANLQWKAELWYSDNLLIGSTVSARDLRDATDAAWLAWRFLEAAGSLTRGSLELSDRVTVALLRVSPPGLK
jgi:hypothetical protein